MTRPTIRNLVLLLTPLTLSGCFVELLGATAITGTLQAEQAQSVKPVLDRANNTAARTSLQSSVDAYFADRGYRPDRLDQLVPNYLNTLPRQSDGNPFGYDPMTGKVLDGPDALRPTSSDQKTMQNAQIAVDSYGQNTGYYPGALDQLIPNYLPELPLTTAGERFHYNSQTGLITHPRAGHAAPVPIAQPQKRQNSTLDHIQNDYGRQQNNVMDQLGL